VTASGALLPASGRDWRLLTTDPGAVLYMA
jgi:hypothetical protein